MITVTIRWDGKVDTELLADIAEILDDRYKITREGRVMNWEQGTGRVEYVAQKPKSSRVETGPISYPIKIDWVDFGHSSAAKG